MEAKGEVHKLKQETNKLAQQRQADTAESYEVVEYLHRDNREKQERIEELQRRLQEQEQSWRNKLEETEKKGE